MGQQKFILPLFYKNLNDSTSAWTDEEFGAYMRLLIYQWSNGEIPKEFPRLNRIAESSERNWGILSKKFKDSGNGLKNAIMEEIRIENDKFKEKQSKNGSKGGNPNFKKGESNPYYKDNPKDNPTDYPKDKPTSTTTTTSLTTTTSTSTKKNKKDEALPLLEYQLCVDFWLKELHQGWDFGGQQGKALKSFIKKIKKILTEGGKEVTTDSIVNSFRFICKNLPDWYKTKDLQVLDSKFNEIVQEIKTPNNGKSGNRKQELSNLKNSAEEFLDGNKSR